MKIGIIGQGFVGSAIKAGLKNFYDIRTYDIDESRCNSTHQAVCYESDIIFVCLPTPMRKDGSCDTRMLEFAIDKAYNVLKDEHKIPKHSDFLNKQNHKKIFVIKSTVPPGTTARIASSYKGIDICFSPEFLTEANSFEDFKNQSRIIIGGPRPATGTVKQMFRKAFPTIPIVKTGTKTAEMVKYFTNCFLATKVTFANEMYDICTAANVDFDKVTEYALHDKRIGNSHLTVPGPDGDRGFGGHCFPKDTKAIVYFAKTLGIDAEVLKSVLNKNDKIRSDRDWEKMKGRAISED